MNKTDKSSTKENVEIKQDLHIHTIYSHKDNSVVPEQTLELIDQFYQAKQIGISDINIITAQSVLRIGQTQFH